MKKPERITIKKVFDVRFKGEPSPECRVLPVSPRIGVSLANLPSIKPKLVVAESDTVVQGQALFYDKTNPHVYVHAPVSGTVHRLVYGPRRQLQCIEIATNSALPPLAFERLLTPPTSAADTKSALLERGLWAYWRQLPFNTIPRPQDTPPAIVVQLANPEPFHPRLSAVLPRVANDITAGLRILQTLCPTIIVVADANESINLDDWSDMAQVVRVDADFNHCSPGAAIYHLKDSDTYNHAWYCDWQFLVKIAQTFATGVYANQSYITLSGYSGTADAHYQVTDGMDLTTVAPPIAKRMVWGGLFSGIAAAESFFLPVGIDAVSWVDTTETVSLMPFLALGAAKPSFTRAYLGHFLKPFTPPSTALGGSYRDCVSCGHCETVCPVHLMPQSLLRQVNADDTDTAIRYGLLDCTQCGVCTYVCPAKIDLSAQFTATKDRLYNEVNA
jgi:Na+-transporting NADH:ubiquinone oxidoreductase subunit A